MRRVPAMLVALVGVSAACGVRTGSAPRPTRPDAHAPAVTWSVALAGEPGALVADGNGVIATVAGRAVISLDRRGGMRWSTPVAGASLGAPAVAGSTVAVPTAGRAAGGCTVLDAGTGAVRWSYVRPGVEGVAAAVAAARVLCVTGDGEIAGLDRASGALVWRADVDVARRRAAVSPRAGVAVDPVTGAVAVTARAGSRWVLVLRGVATGRDLGTVDLGDRLPPSSPVAVGGGRVAVATGGGEAAALRVVDARTARVVSEVALDAPDGFDPASIPLVAGGTVVVAGRDGRIDAVDLVSGRPCWTARTAAPILDARPVAAGAAVVVTDWTRRTFAFGLADGRPRRLPASAGWAVALAPGPAPGLGAVDVALRSLAGGRIEQWTVGR